MKQYDVIIIGGSYAGLSAALFLANAKRNILIIDSNQARNKQANFAHNVLTNDYKTPQELLELAQNDLKSLKKIEQINDFVTTITGSNDTQFCIITSTNQHYIANKIIFATGVIDILPNIENIHPFWVRNIFHCPYCIAPEIENMPLAVYSTDDEAFDLALIMHKWTNDFVLLTNGANVLSTEQKKIVSERNIKIYNEKIQRFSGKQDIEIISHFKDGTTLSRRGIFMHLPFQQTAKELLTQLNCPINESQLVSVNEFFQTPISGVYAIGDMSQMIQKVTTAIASGTVAGFMVDKELSV